MCLKQDYREMLEPVITGLAVSRATKEDINELKRIFADMQESINDIHGFADLDLSATITGYYLDSLPSFRILIFIEYFKIIF